MKRLALTVILFWVLALPVLTVQAQASTYLQKVLAVQLPDLVAYWPLNEVAGTAANDVSGNGRHGTYYGATLDYSAGPDAKPAPRFDGINDYVNVFSSGLASSWSGNTGTLMAWLRVLDASVWTDSANRRAVWLDAPTGHSLGLTKTSTANTMQGIRIASATNRNQVTTVSHTSWFHVAITWSTSADAVRVFYNGVEVGTPTPTIGSWVNTPATAVIGAATPTPAGLWNGQIAHVALWKAALSSVQIASLADVTVSSATVTPAPPNVWSDTLSLPGGKTGLVEYAIDGGQWVLIFIGLVQTGLLLVLVFRGLFETARRSR